MPITATVSRSYSIRMIALAVLCLVFGIWGLYDYYVGIPVRQQLADRFDMLSKVRSVFEQTPADDTYNQALVDAKAAVQQQQIGLPISRNVPDAASGMVTEQQAQEMISALRENVQDQSARAALAFLAAALEQPRSASGVLTQQQMLANQIAVDALAGMESVNPPSGFDRAFQWVYILCLPFAPYFLWQWWKKYKQRYTLDEDGTLHLPDGAAWTEDDITDIDMNRWMEKSLAMVVHRDGTRAELDDYYFQNMHLIVGKIAHGFHPDQWHDDARQVRADAAEDDADAGDPPSRDAADAGPDKQSDDDPPRMPLV